MKWLGLLIPFAVGYWRKQSRNQGSLKASAWEMYDTLTVKSRDVVFSGLAALVGLTVMCGSFFMFVSNSTSQYDLNRQIFWNSTLIVSGSLCLISICALAYVYYYAWPGVTAQSKLEILNKRRAAQDQKSWSREHPQHSPSSFEAAVSMLIMDWVSERQSSREARNYQKHLKDLHLREQATRTTPLVPDDRFQSTRTEQDELNRKPDLFH